MRYQDHLVGQQRSERPWAPHRFTTIVGTNQGYAATNEDTIDTAFRGDFSRSPFPVEHRIVGAATLTQPTTGYIYSPWAYPYYTFLYNESGFNNGTADNVGRTAACAFRTKVFHIGQGDAVAYNASVFVTGTRAGSTNFLANPAGVAFNGDLFAGADGVYLNAGEVQLNDQGFDAAGIGWVVNLNRTLATGAKSAWWSGFRVQSIGSADVNAAFSAAGKYDVGLDFTSITTDASKAWAAVKADDRIYFNATSSNGFYATSLGAIYAMYNSVASGLDFVMANNSPSLRLTTVATPVNFIVIQGRETGVAAIITADGGDTNIGVIHSTKGTGAHSFRTRGASFEQFAVVDTNNAANNYTVTGAAAGSPPTMAAIGSDGNIDMLLTPKGTGLVRFGTFTGSGDVAVNGSVSIRDAGGTIRKLATVA